MTQPILQFGTGRFLQAHVDLLVSQALDEGLAIGGIAVVQTTDSAASSARLAAMARGEPYGVRVRGVKDGVRIDDVVQVHSVREAWHAERDWLRVREVATTARLIVSNTADEGYVLHPGDGPAALADPPVVPRSFPAKLLCLLHHRWQRDPAAPLTLLPCELVSRNADVLRDIVCRLAQAWFTPREFQLWLRSHCVWVNSLVDRIVSEPLQPLGAVAEPYALWAVERRDGMVLPCTHPCIVVTDDLGPFERLKLYLLNLGHTFLAERWIVDARPASETVFEAMNDPALRAELEAVWLHEVLPVFDALGEGAEARAYLVGLRDRLLNPFLAHRLADIAGNHAAKKQRRIAALLALADERDVAPTQHRLRAAMSTTP
ncbi:MAG: mannitol dehydrogenase family protein [Rhizobacter sp.]